MTFEAHVERGRLDLFLPRARKTPCLALSVEPRAAKRLHLRDHYIKDPQFLGKVQEVVDTVSLPGEEAAWRRWRIRFLGSKYALHQENTKIFSGSVRGAPKGLLRFQVYNGSRVRLRSVRLRKLSAP
jgi:hypothetical protein